MKQKLMLAGIVVCLAFLANQVSAQPPCRMMAGAQNNPPGWGCPVWQNLTPEQQGAINSLHAEFNKKTSATQNQIHKKRLEMDKLLLDADPDADTLIKLQKEISGLTARMDEEELSYLLKARKTLTPDQIAQLPPGCTFGFGGPPCGAMQGAGPGMGGGRYGGRGR